MGNSFRSQALDKKRDLFSVSQANFFFIVIGCLICTCTYIRDFLNLDNVSSPLSLLFLVLYTRHPAEWTHGKSLRFNIQSPSLSQEGKRDISR